MIYVTSDEHLQGGLSPQQERLKRAFDLLVSTLGLLFFGWLILFSFVAATIDTGSNGFFRQIRIGRYGKPFRVFKLKTMRHSDDITTSVTTKNDPRITRLGRFFRRTKLDELPQLINVFLGQMSLVGPRPDVPGFADKLEGEDRLILTVRPGITGPATLKYRNEEELLAEQPDPETYNRDIIFVDKVRLNREYVQTYSFAKDIGYIVETVLG